jgi:hypothetical protein
MTMSQIVGVYNVNPIQAARLLDIVRRVQNAEAEEKAPDH